MSIQYKPYVSKEDGHSHEGHTNAEGEHDETGSNYFFKYLIFFSRFEKFESLLSEHAHFDPAAHSTLRVLILVGALALHAVFEGLVFGVSQEPVSAMLGTHT